jgi:tol-pal system-associated acyl-CoA thioesterase
MRFRIYYAETDAGGVTYYANYLRFAEAGRYEYCRALGIDLAAWQEKGLVFAVVEINARYHSPARLGDEIEVRTVTSEIRKAGVTFESTIHHAASDSLLFSATIRAAALTGEGKPARMPREIAGPLEAAQRGESPGH